MLRSSEIEASGRIVLECGCGERLVLLGREDDWYSEGRGAFACECGKELTLSDRMLETSDFTRLIRGFELPHRS